MSTLCHVYECIMAVIYVRAWENDILFVLSGIELAVYFFCRCLFILSASEVYLIVLCSCYSFSASVGACSLICSDMSCSIPSTSMWYNLVQNYIVVVPELLIEFDMCCCNPQKSIQFKALKLTSLSIYYNAYLFGRILKYDQHLSLLARSLVCRTFPPIRLKDFPTVQLKYFLRG